MHPVGEAREGKPKQNTGSEKSRAALAAARAEIMRSGNLIAIRHLMVGYPSGSGFSCARAAAYTMGFGGPILA